MPGSSGRRETIALMALALTAWERPQDQTRAVRVKSIPRMPTPTKPRQVLCCLCLDGLYEFTKKGLEERWSDGYTIRVHGGLHR